VHVLDVNECDLALRKRLKKREKKIDEGYVNNTRTAISVHMTNLSPYG
jgi:hypothetical protein